MAGKWTVQGRAPLRIPQDPWPVDGLQQVRDKVAQKAQELGVDIVTNPRRILDEPELCALLWPATEKFFLDDDALELDVRSFMSLLVSKGVRIPAPSCFRPLSVFKDLRHLANLCS